MDRRPRGSTFSSDTGLVQQPPPEYRASRTNLHPSSAAGSPSSLRGLASQKPSTWKVVAKVLPRWLMIVTMNFVIYAVLLHYQSLTVMTKTEKRIFNSLITGLSIGLGVAVASSLDGMVGDLRWWILSRRFRSKRKVELILQADSMLHLLKLAYRTRRSSIRIAVFLWGLLILGSQVAVASIGLCYSTDTAEKYPLMDDGSVAIPDLTSIQAGAIVTESDAPLGAQQYMANNYGIISTASKLGENFSVIPEEQTIIRPGDPLMFCQGQSSRCRYIFKELSVDPTQQGNEAIISITTTRSIDVSTKCNAWPVIAGGNGNRTSILIATPQGNTNISIPILVGTNATIYMTNTSSSCGNGCSQLSAFEASSTSPWYYKCNVTLGPVANATRPEHEATDELTSLLAASIALQGYSASSLAGDAVVQFQTYPAESLFGNPVQGNVDSLAHIISRFTIGAMAAFADNNNFVQVEGLAPRRGIVLDITHPAIVLFILLLISGMTLALEITMAIWSNRVVVPSDSPLAVAQVLRAMTWTRHPGQLRSYTPSDTKSLTDKYGEPLWIYRSTPVVGDDGMFDLYMESSTLTPQSLGPDEIEMTGTSPSLVR